jgi:hypothetical protein
MALMLTSVSVTQFGDALSSLKSSLSPHDAPIDWIDDNINQILAAATGVLEFSSYERAGLHMLLFPVSSSICFMHYLI